MVAQFVVKELFGAQVQRKEIGPEKEVGSLYDHPYASKGEVKEKALQEVQRVVAYIRKEVFPIHGI